jgi:N-acetylneuraminic acid mutarotase
MAAGDLESRNIDTCQTDSDRSAEVVTKHFAGNTDGWKTNVGTLICTASYRNETLIGPWSYHHNNKLYVRKKCQFSLLAND